MEFEALPEDCIAAVLSPTTPVDVCRLSSVSKILCSATDSDAVWSRFLPSDSHFSSIISQSPSLANTASKKALYLALSDRPIIIHQGTQSFQLERNSGKKCYMLGARALHISWGDTPMYWTWITMPDSRFEEVARLNYVWWFEIRGKINTNLLSSNTHYEAFLIFKLEDVSSGFNHVPTEMSVGILGGQSCTKNVWLDTRDNIEDELERPKLRSDGWLEIKMGEFFNSGLENEELHMSVLETKDFKQWFFLEGIEIRPKQ